MMIKTSRITPEYYSKPNENIIGKNNTSRDYRYVVPKNPTYITNRSTHGPYNITERDFGDHKLSYFVPAEYEDDYDISQLDERLVYENDEEEEEDHHSPRLVRRRYHRYYNDYDDNYNEELPMISSRRYTTPPRKRPLIIKRIYFQPTTPPPTPPPQTVEYIYENDYRPKNEETIEYVVPRRRYVEQSQPVHRPVYIEDLPPTPRSPHHVMIPAQTSSPPPPPPAKSLQFNEYIAPRQSKIKHQSPRATTSHVPSIKSSSEINKNRNHLSLKQVLAQNRARRGPHMPPIRREISEEHFHDLPTYNKNYVKNGFIVHK